MKTRLPPKVGQVLFMVQRGYREKDAPKFSEESVKKVGRKYFTIGEGYLETQFYIESWREKTDYASNISLYESRQEYEDEVEAMRLSEELRIEFASYSKARPLDMLREVKAIVEKYKQAEGA